MRIAIVTESFLPQVNGVTNTVRHTLDRLLDLGHEAMVIAPGQGPATYCSAPVVRVRSVGLPGYRSFSVGLPDSTVERSLEQFGPDLVHLASPFALGAIGLRAACRLDIPTVAVYQTDIAGFARHYGIRADAAISRWVGRIHRRADRTLVPSTSAYDQLAALGVANLHLWRRGVSLDLFSPGRRSHEMHDRWTDGSPGSVVVGYVGRLAPEKQVRRLVEISSVPGTRLVVVGDGPARGWLERQLPDAVFTGMLRGEDLARVFASLDVFVHTGESETFCQTVQEAQASGVAVAAPAVGGPLDLVTPGRTGLLFDPADRKGLRRCVETLVDDEVLRTEMAAEAIRTVARRSWTSVVDELIELHYSAVLRRHGAVA